MPKRYLLEQDYNWIADPEDFAIISYQSDSYTVEDAEATAVEDVCKIIRASRGVNYNLNLLIRPIETYNNTADYVVNDLVWQLNSGGNVEIYTCVQAHQAQPLNDADYWKLGDTRDKTIKRAISAFAVYDMYQHISAKMIPIRIEQLYKQYKQELEDIRDGKQVPNWAVIASTEEPNGGIYIKSNGRRNFYS